MIKIAYIIDEIDSPTGGGTENQLLNLIDNIDLSKFMPNLYVLRSTEWLEKSFDLCPVTVLGVDSFKQLSFPGCFLRLVKSLRREQINVVHCFFKDGSRIGIPAAKLAGAPMIIAARRNQGYWMHRADLQVTKVMNRWVDLMIANAEDTKNWTVKTEGFPADKIHVVHNGVDLVQFAHLPTGGNNELRREFGIQEKAPVVGIVANLRPVKDIATFIRASKAVKQMLPNAHFVVVGEGNLLNKLQSLAAHVGLGQSVHFTGSRTDIPQILSMFDVGVLTSISESFSNTITEYLAAGLPIVCTDVGGAREAVENGVNGYLVPPQDEQVLAEKIVDILNDQEKILNMSDRSRKLANRFSLKSMVEHHQQIYSRALLDYNERR